MSVRDIAHALDAAGIDSPEHDARVLAAHAAETGADLDELVRRRVARVPLQHITGVAGFRYLDLAVGPGVFVPRPETEVVAGVAIDLARAAGTDPVVVDLCSGSGAIALSVAQEVPGAVVHAVESDPRALEWLQHNAVSRRAAGDPPITAHAVDLRDTPAGLDGTVDVVVANPPYLSADEVARLEPEVAEHDPGAALVAGDGGLADIRAVAETAVRLLRSGGWLVVEHGDGQGESAPAELRRLGFAEVRDGRDLAGRDRYVTGRRP
jgi:release factor glutamine methyltransferase